MSFQFRAMAVPDFMNREAPPNYVAGLGRGAVGFVTTADLGPGAAISDNQDERFANDNQKYDKDDDEADRIYEMVDKKLAERNAGRRAEREKAELERNSKKTTVRDQFIDLKRDLVTMTNEDWSSIPEVVDMVRKRGTKKARDEVYERNSAIPDTVLLKQATQATHDNEISEDYTQFSKAKNQMLELKLDQLGDTSNTVDAKSFQAQMDEAALKSDAEINDIKKARMLLKSVTTANPKHAPGWIAAARLEEVAGKLKAARNLILKGCENCPRNEDIWLETVRLSSTADAKILLAQAVKKLPQSVALWMKAKDLETDVKSQKRVLRKALEYIPNSVELWKATVSTEEDPENAKLLLSKAVECVPSSIEMWLAFAKLESGQNAQKILNRARVANPTSYEIWLAAAKLMEKEQNFERIGKVLDSALKELKRVGAMLTREEWISEAEKCDKESMPKVSYELLKRILYIDVDEMDQIETWMEDAENCVKKKSFDTCRHIYNIMLEGNPDDEEVWSQFAFFEKEHGDYNSLCQVLERAITKVPHAKIIWLLYAKEVWTAGDPETARSILKDAVQHNLDSEEIWLAAIKLEMETGNFDAAQTVLEEARKNADTERMWMKSSILKRVLKKYDAALEILDEAILKFPKFHKLWLIKGQILADDLKKNEEARLHFELATQKLPKCPIIWIFYSRLEEKLGNSIKSRAILERARIMNPRDAELWYEAVEVEKRANNNSMAKALLSKALQECPTAGKLWVTLILSEIRPQRKARANDALKKCENDALVVNTVARLFWADRKIEMARKWFKRAVDTNNDIGDCWAWWLKFEQVHGNVESQEGIIEKCIKAEPKHGVEWPKEQKKMSNFGKPCREILLSLASRFENKI